MKTNPSPPALPLTAPTDQDEQAGQKAGKPAGEIDSGLPAFRPAGLPRVGQPVLYALAEGHEKCRGQKRFGVVVNVNGDGTANLQVFTDSDGNKTGDWLPALLWKRGVPYDPAGAPGSWQRLE